MWRCKTSFRYPAQEAMPWPSACQAGMYQVFQDYSVIPEKVAGQPPQRERDWNKPPAIERRFITASVCYTSTQFQAQDELPHVNLSPSAQLCDPGPSWMALALLSFPKGTVVKAWELKSCKIRTVNMVYCWYRNSSSSRTWEKILMWKSVKPKGFSRKAVKTLIFSIIAH